MLYKQVVKKLKKLKENRSIIYIYNEEPGYTIIQGTKNHFQYIILRESELKALYNKLKKKYEN